MVPASDEALLLRVAEGDSEAFEVLLDRWEGPAKRYACRVLGDAHAAEDIAQEAFLRLHRGARDWRPTARFSTWFYTILGNLCRDRIRRLRRRPEEGAGRPLGEGEDEPADPGASVPGPLEAALEGERRDLVAEAVRSLPTHLQQAVALREFEGLKYREIAATLDCDLNEVKVLIHRGRKALAERLRRVLRDPAGE
jgi:RNA polymerase sigma-70 factor (ECF subfamily)